MVWLRLTGVSNSNRVMKGAIFIASFAFDVINHRICWFCRIKLPVYRGIVCSFQGVSHLRTFYLCNYFILIVGLRLMSDDRKAAYAAFVFSLHDKQCVAHWHRMCRKWQPMCRVTYITLTKPTRHPSDTLWLAFQRSFSLYASPWFLTSTGTGFLHPQTAQASPTALNDGCK